MSLDCWAVTHPGIETITAAEITRLGLEPLASEPGGVGFRATQYDLARCNVHLRTAARVTVRVSEFRAVSFADLERHGRRVPWAEFVPPAGTVRFRVTSRKSRLYHQDAIAERLARGLGRALPGARVRTGGTEEADADEQLFVVRLLRDRCTISADSSGPLLHRRGYRIATAKAPLRETLAAAMLLSIGWDGTAPLVDPLCGSGTIPVEAALIARNIAPGAARDFVCERWPSARGVDWPSIRKAAADGVRAMSVAVEGSDRDAGAVAAARQNAERAGVAGDVGFHQRPLSASVAPTPDPGWIVTNPPYGARVRGGHDLRDLYARLGRLLSTSFAGWHIALLIANPALAAQVAVPLVERFATNNGGISVRLASSG